MENYTLDPQLQSDTLALAKLELCEVRLFKSSDYPWLILIPMRAGAIEVGDLTKSDQETLWQEVLAMSTLLQEKFHPDKMNLACLGNVVSQLHFHVIARFKSDPHWPAPVWGKEVKCEAAKLEHYRQGLGAALNQG